jgi:hypothetical protein
MMFGRTRLVAAALLATLAIALTSPGSASAQMGTASTSCSISLQVSSIISERACVILHQASVQFRLEITNSGATSKSVTIGVATIENGNTSWCKMDVAYLVPAATTAGFDCSTSLVSGSSYRTQGYTKNNGVPVNVFSPTIVG